MGPDSATVRDDTSVFVLNMRNKLQISKEKIIKLGRSPQMNTVKAAWHKMTWLKVFKILAILGIVGFFCMTLFIAWLTRDLPDPDNLQDRVIVESTKMFDRTGTHLLYEMYDEKKRTIVEISELPRYVIDATIAIEDSHFYEHKGIRWPSLARAIVSDIFQLSSGQGGASTLTQQLVKNAILTNEKSLSRKIKEGILALQIERIYTKDQILKLYFNEIPYGSTNYGIESAAQAYFAKPAKDLTLAEAATLAAMPQSPSRYMRRPELLKGRRDYILLRMKDLKYISDAEMRDAQAQNSDIHPVKGVSVAPHFVDYLTAQLAEEFGEKTLDQGGLKITTTIDYDLQLAANAIVKKGVESAEKKYNATNGALLSIDATNGEILAMVGSRDYFDDERGGMFNVVTQSIRQPGSSFKPIVYAAAFEKGFPPETVFYDAQTKFNYDGQSYEPHNYDGSTHGPVTMRQALQGSLNIPAVKTIFLVGIDNALDFAARLGYTTFTDRTKFGPSVVLGGGGVKMIEHVRAYGAFANGGKMNEPFGILKVEDKKGVDITPKRKEAKQVITPELAATVSNVLSDNAARAYVFGANNRLTLGNRPVAAKTGTTNDYHDAWTMGYTPQVVTGVWVGNNNNAVMKRGADGSVIAAPIWQEFMFEATKKLPVAAFAPAPPNTATNVMLQGLLGGGITVAVDNISGKLATEETPPENVVKQLYIPGHDILYYVNPNDPLGPPPTDPGSEPQFAAWEAGVQNWIISKESSGFKVGTPPTEYDDVHKKELAPVLSVTYPQADQVVTGSYFVPQISVSAVRGVQRVEYLIDQKLLANPTVAPFTAPITLDGLGFGDHTLEIRAFDDVGNKTVQSIVFKIGPVAF